jgi:hypothetical protein
MQDICQEILNVNRTEKKGILTIIFIDLIKSLSIYKLTFLPGDFSPNEKVIGELYFKNNLWLNESLILNIDICVSFNEMTKSKKSRLLYLPLV